MMSLRFVLMFIMSVMVLRSSNARVRSVRMIVGCTGGIVVMGGYKNYNYCGCLLGNRWVFSHAKGYGTSNSSTTVPL